MLWIDPDFIDSCRRVAPLSVATLGPAGTSSEAAARQMFAHLGGDEQGQPNALKLFTTYESAGEAVRNHAADLLLVANAYADISQFYMDPRLRFVGAFVFDTPEYGIAARPGTEIPSRVIVASHPAPMPLIGELMPQHIVIDRVITANSTSTAAASVRLQEVDLALTTVPAAIANGLQFISKTRPIRMLWSTFTLCDAVERRSAARH